MRTKIIVWSFVPTAIILLAVALVTFFAFQSVTEDLVIERDREVTYVAAGRLAAKLEEYEGFLTGVARTPEISENDAVAQRDALNKAGNRLAVFDAGVVLLDAFGQVVATQPGRTEILGQSWADHAYYQEIVRSQIGGTSPGLALSNIVPDGPDGADVIVLALPLVGEQDRFHGILAGMFYVSPTAANTFYADIVRLRIGESGSTYLVDSTGRVIYHSDIDRIGDDFSAQAAVRQVLSDHIDALRTRDFDGNDIVAGFAPVPGTPWGLVTEEAWSALTDSFRGYRNFLLILLVLGVVMPAIVVGIGVRRITKPITDLIRAAQEVAQGRFGQTITAKTGDEIEELAEQFNLMSARLKESYADLEQKVADRTRELATLNTIASVVSRSLDLDEILRDALDEALAMFAMDAGAILLTEPGGEVMTSHATRGFSEEFLEAVPYIRGGGRISAQAVAQGKPVVLDSEAYARGELTKHLASSVLEEGVKTLVSTPLLHKGEALGVMNLVTRRPRVFPPEELELLTAIGQHIGVAVENARLYEQAQQELTERARAERKLRRLNEERARRNRELVLLNRVIAATTSRLEPNAVLEAICRELALAFRVPEVGAALLQEDGTALTVVAEHRSEDRPSAVGTVLPVQGNPSAEYVLQHNAPLAVPDAQHDPVMAPVHGLMRERRAASLLIVPLTVRNEVVGTIGMVTVERREFTDDEVALAASAAAAASQALEQARAEEALRGSQQRLSLHVQHTPLAYIEWDADLRVIEWNPSAERIFGYSEQEAKEHHAYEIIVSPEAQPHVTGVWHSLLKQSGGTRSANENVTKDGRRIMCEWYNTPLIDDAGKVIGLASLVQDITERVQAEEALREAKEAAEAASQAKSTFLANISHELRTPLNAILGFAQLMTRDPDVTADQFEKLEIIGRSGEHLLGLINDVLETSKLEAGRVTLQEESFDLNRMLDGLEEMFQLRARGRGLALIFDRAPDVPQYVRADEGKLRQVLMNLLGNAIKFTEEGGVSLRVGRSPLPAVGRFEEQEGRAWLRFEVEDTGPGIAPEEMAAVFDPFVQTEAGRKSHEGTGLGLPISRRFVRLMGGDFTVRSEEVKGSVFSFDLPMEAVEAAEVRIAQPRRRAIGLELDQPVYRLLIAEDQETNRKLLVNLLAPFGFELREAVNGQEALEIWEDWEPHLIWMDLRMPVMDGFEATKRIKSIDRGQATVVIALTASAFDTDQALIVAEGCDGFLRKPFREEDILNMLVKHLDVRFVYEEQAAPLAEDAARPETGVITPETLADLPPALVAELHQAAIRLDADVILELIDRIRHYNASLADTLSRLVHEFRFDTITTLTGPLENEYEQ